MIDVCDRVSAIDPVRPGNCGNSPKNTLEHVASVARRLHGPSCHMEERSNHITVIVGASTLAEDLRRMLVRRKVAHAGVATHLRGLRRSMALGESDLMIICIALDQRTIDRHGESLRKLLADCHCFPQAVRSVGFLTEVGLTSDTATLGCDVYAHDSEEAARAVRLLAKKWNKQRSRAAGSPAHKPAAVVKAESRNAWVWGTDFVPAGFESLLKQESELLAGAAANGGKPWPPTRGRRLALRRREQD